MAARQPAAPFWETIYIAVLVARKTRQKVPAFCVKGAQASIRGPVTSWTSMGSAGKALMRLSLDHTRLQNPALDQFFTNLNGVESSTFA